MIITIQHKIESREERLQVWKKRLSSSTRKGTTQMAEIMIDSLKKEIIKLKQQLNG